MNDENYNACSKSGILENGYCSSDIFGTFVDDVEEMFGCTGCHD